jgi:hypothetical protein
MVHTKIIRHQISCDLPPPLSIIQIPIAIGPEIEPEEEPRQPKICP